MLDQNKKKYKL